MILGVIDQRRWQPSSGWLTRLVVLGLLVGVPWTIGCSAPSNQPVTASRSGLRSLVFEERFETDLNRWIVEKQGTTGTVQLSGGELDIESRQGVTVWFAERLNGGIEVEYDVRLLADGRISDQNQFWMATNPENPGQRPAGNGAFASYHCLKLYYAGHGSNDNTTTRFRRYDGECNRVLLEEHVERDYLLSAGTRYSIRIRTEDGRTQFFVNDQVYWDFSDNDPLRAGWFGFRTVNSHHRIDNFRVFALQSDSADAGIGVPPDAGPHVTDGGAGEARVDGGSDALLTDSEPDSALGPAGSGCSASDNLPDRTAGTAWGIQWLPLGLVLIAWRRRSTKLLSS